MTLSDIEIKSLWKRKNLSIDFEVFKNWYLQQDRKCNYCNITEEQIELLLSAGQLFTKRISTRGKRLELDRKKSEQEYNNLDNLVLSCYWCNNAKTDTFTDDEFKKVGETIKQIWEQRLKNLDNRKNNS